MTTRDQAAKQGELVQFPDLKPKTRRALLQAEIGTQFDVGQRLFAYYGQGDVFDLAGLRGMGRPRHESHVQAGWHLLGHRNGAHPADP
jgi:hypothetical protein